MYVKIIPRKYILYPNLYQSVSSPATSYDMYSGSPQKSLGKKTPLQDWRRLHAVILAERNFQSILPTLSCNLIAAPFELQDCERDI